MLILKFVSAVLKNTTTLAPQIILSVLTINILFTALTTIHTVSANVLVMKDTLQILLRLELQVKKTFSQILKTGRSEISNRFPNIFSADWECENQYGTCVKLYKNLLTWSDAQDYCMSLNADLVTIFDQDYQNWVRSSQPRFIISYNINHYFFFDFKIF